MSRIKHSRETKQRIHEMYAIGRYKFNKYSKGKYTLREIGETVGVNEKVVWNIANDK